MCWRCGAVPMVPRWASAASGDTAAGAGGRIAFRKDSPASRLAQPRVPRMIQPQRDCGSAIILNRLGAIRLGDTVIADQHRCTESPPERRSRVPKDNCTLTGAEKRKNIFAMDIEDRLGRINRRLSAGRDRDRSRTSVWTRRWTGSAPAGATFATRTSPACRHWASTTSTCLAVTPLRCRKRLLAENCGRCAIQRPPATTMAESNFRFRCYGPPRTAR